MNRFLLSHSRSRAFVRGASGKAMRNKSRPLSPLICIILLYGLLQVTLRKERTTACGLTCMTAKPSASLNVQSSLGSPFSRKVVLHLPLGRPLGIFSLKVQSHMTKKYATLSIAYIELEIYCKICYHMTRGTQQEYSSNPLKDSVVKRTF